MNVDDGRKEAPDWIVWFLAAQGGDDAAYGRLVERFWGELVRLAHGVMGCHAEDEDIVQDCLVAAWSRLRTLREPAGFPAWLRRAVVRRAWRRARWQLRFQPLRTIDPASAQARDPGLRIDLSMLIAQLPARQRAVLFLTEIEGWTDQEAATCLGIAPATLRVHRHRAHTTLRRSLKEAH